MGRNITLRASDGFTLNAYRADPPRGEPRGAVVVIQEIFGVNVHIRDVCERYAEIGYTAIAPALYDRFHPGFDVGYGPDDIAKGRVYKAQANEAMDQVLADVEAARAEAAKVTGQVGLTGFCWGGVVTWVGACRLGFQAASGYYGGGILPYLDEQPNCPTLLHFGRADASIPMADVEQIVAADHPDVDVHVYEAGHGFNCDLRADFSPHAAQVAAMRTVRLFDAALTLKGN